MNQEQKIKMIGAIKGMLKNGLASTQEDIRNELKKLGFDVTQSTISRTLKRIGAMKAIDEDRLSYRLQPANKRISYSHSIKDIVTDVSSNETTIVIKTLPGSAMFVAGFLDSAFQNEVLGTVGGDDTVIVIPRSVKDIADITSILENTIEQAP